MRTRWDGDPLLLAQEERINEADEPLMRKPTETATPPAKICRSILWLTNARIDAHDNCPRPRRAVNPATFAARTDETLWRTRGRMIDV